MQTTAPHTKATPPPTIDNDEDFADEVLLLLRTLNIMLTSCLPQGATLSQKGGGEERARPRPGKALAMSKTASQPKPASQGGACGLTAEELLFSQRASLQGGRASQSEARQASQASGFQVQFYQNFLHFHHDQVTKEASNTMLVAATGYADSFWRPSAWCLCILVDLPPKPGWEKMEKLDIFLVRMEEIIVRMKKNIVRMEKFAVKMEKIIVSAWLIWSSYLEAVNIGLSSGHKERALRCLFC